ncbi:hypothetical protein D3P09_04230 [Paenibacillus pinisoli]|uniref:Glycosyl hydrolase n=1 Tax=Paenibacillus pinisoli TaxID=1276110 RepID=A0A3A6PHA5_9BACL|nr:hypothetical protein [Paenibacillus pinisoli]RJX41202.1 hypothetical protein D3P09_04230 [Paenibacillus pinisoli]
MHIRYGWILAAAVLLLVLNACAAGQRNTVSPPIDVIIDQSDEWKKEAQALHNFIVNQLSGDYGVYTNWKDTGQSELAATGHEVLSESAGLLLRYYARTGQKDAFDRTWEQAKATFNLDSGFSYRYSPIHQKRYTLNAAVDDLRLIRALYEAEAAFGTGDYRKEAHSYGSRFYSYNVHNGQMYDFYDEAYRTRNEFVTLCYIDLKSLQLMELPEEQKSQLVSEMTDTIQHGYISDAFPFYETRYEYKSDSYKSEQINTVESLLTILHLAETSRQKETSIQFIKERVAEGKLYGQYTRDGKPASDVRSTAIYAITAMIGAEIGDPELYDESLQRMNEFMVQDAGHPFYEAYGDTVTEAAYSFDNLMALLAYTY